MSQPKLTAEQKQELDKQEAEAKKAAKKEADLLALFARIDRAWPVRCKLAELAGFKANLKNIMALMDTEFDLSIGELYLQVKFRKPENELAALTLLQEFYKS